jgi:hypothetical protein
LFSFGTNQNQQLGIGKTNINFTEIPQPVGANIFAGANDIKIAAGWYHGVAVKGLKLKSCFNLAK